MNTLRSHLAGTYLALASITTKANYKKVLTFLAENLDGLEDEDLVELALGRLSLEDALAGVCNQDDLIDDLAELCGRSRVQF